MDTTQAAATTATDQGDPMTRHNVIQPMNRLRGHALVAEGAPFERRGHRLTGKGGRALCECGELSPPLANTSRRKAWHRDEHKPAVRNV